MPRRDPEHENTTLRIPPKRVPEAETLRIARFAQPSEPRALVGQRRRLDRWVAE